jgi:putative DNA primase/helicase
MNNTKDPQLQSAGQSKNTKNSRSDYRPAFAQEQQIQSIIQQFREYISVHGILFRGEIIPDGKLHRFHIEGHKRGTRNGAYILYADKCPAGWFQDFKSGISRTWRSSSGSFVSNDLIIRIEEAKRQRETEQRQAQQKAAAKAAYIWRFSKPVTNHPYLTVKRIQSHGARLYHDALVIPIYNESGRLVNFQFINADGDKRFLSGGCKRSCFHVIGNLTNRILICEGFATGASLYENSCQRVVVAFDAGNLLPVSDVIKTLHPAHEIIICGDNDKSGIGQTKAREAALAVGGKILIPPIPGQDWNDFLTGVAV